MQTGNICNVGVRHVQVHEVGHACDNGDIVNAVVRYNQPGDMDAVAQGRDVVRVCAGDVQVLQRRARRKRGDVEHAAAAGGDVGEMVVGGNMGRHGVYVRVADIKRLEFAAVRQGGQVADAGAGHI